MTEEEYEDLEYGSGYLDDERDTRILFGLPLRETTDEEKAKLIQPLFTLTAEEIMEVKCAIVNRIHDLKIMSVYSSRPDVFLLESIKICENLFKRLNDYGKEV